MDFGRRCHSGLMCVQVVFVPFLFTLCTTPMGFLKHGVIKVLYKNHIHIPSTSNHVQQTIGSMVQGLVSGGHSISTTHENTFMANPLTQQHNGDYMMVDCFPCWILESLRANPLRGSRTIPFTITPTDFIPLMLEWCRISREKKNGTFSICKTGY